MKGERTFWFRSRRPRQVCPLAVDKGPAIGDQELEFPDAVSERGQLFACVEYGLNGLLAITTENESQLVRQTSFSLRGDLGISRDGQ
jgi:hypothetical protein